MPRNLSCSESNLDRKTNKSQNWRLNCNRAKTTLFGKEKKLRRWSPEMSSLTWKTYWRRKSTSQKYKDKTRRMNDSEQDYSMSSPNSRKSKTPSRRCRNSNYQTSTRIPLPRSVSKSWSLWKDRDSRQLLKLSRIPSPSLSREILAR